MKCAGGSELLQKRILKGVSLKIVLFELHKYNELKACALCCVVFRGRGLTGSICFRRNSLIRETTIWPNRTWSQVYQLHHLSHLPKSCFCQHLKRYRRESHRLFQALSYIHLPESDTRVQVLRNFIATECKQLNRFPTHITLGLSTQACNRVPE